MKPYWSRKWVIGWIVILSVALAYELIAFAFEVTGTRAFPTLSSIIVGLVPLPILEPLTIVIALVLCWHWIDVNRREK